jgi:hypothetical protein
VCKQCGKTKGIDHYIRSSGRIGKVCNPCYYKNKNKNQIVINTNTIVIINDPQKKVFVGENVNFNE